MGDMVYGDIGAFFQNQRMISNDCSKPYQITPVCAPSRGSLLTVVNQGNANVRGNQFDKTLEDNHTLGTVLKQADFQTMARGKLRQQGVEKAGPYWPAHLIKRGFDSYYGYIRLLESLILMCIMIMSTPLMMMTLILSQKKCHGNAMRLPIAE